ncbi:MAG: SDR family oxidoreductase, partial [Gemmatimonadetes bacterium]|nr:SDR family oxidoreductase [Gemmatimonadota bacterium]
MAAAFGKTALVTGATGLVGREALARLLQDRPSLTVYALVRSRERFAGLAAELGPLAVNVTLVRGDVTAPGLGLSRAARSLLRNRVTTVLHLAADTTFSRPLEEARRVNTEGTARVLELAAECVSTPRVLFVSTAFVAGRRTGRVPEAENGAEPGFVNAYEQSKYEAEQLVRACGLPWLILRPSMIVCDARTGVVRQFNAVHRALRLYYHG